MKKSGVKKVKSHFEKELLKLERMNSQVAEYGVQRNYLETNFLLLLDLPWDEFSKNNFDLKRALEEKSVVPKQILDRDHLWIGEGKKTCN